jgi:hypothetical protein
MEAVLLLVGQGLQDLLCRGSCPFSFLFGHGKIAIAL